MKPKFDRFRYFFSNFFSKKSYIFIVVSTFCPQDGFLAPWDPSQKKDRIFLRRMVPLRPLYDEIWPDSGQFKVPNLTFLPSRPNITKESPPEIREGSFYLAFTTWSTLPEFPVVMLSSLVLGKRTKGWPPNIKSNFFCFIEANLKNQKNPEIPKILGLLCLWGEGGGQEG